MLNITNDQGNAKPQDITSHMSEWLSSKRTQITNVGEDVEKREPLYTVGGNVNWYSHCGNGMEVSRKKPKIELSSDPEIPILGTYPKTKTKTLIQKDTWTPTLIAVLFTIAKTWKQPKCPSTDEWIKKMWYIYKMEHYPAIKKMNFCLLQQHGCFFSCGLTGSPPATATLRTVKEGEVAGWLTFLSEPNLRNFGFYWTTFKFTG